MARDAESGSIANKATFQGNKMQRSEQHQKDKRTKAQAKLKRRMAQKKAESANPALKKERLEKNVPRTVENSKTWVGMNEDGEVLDPRTIPVKVLQDGATGDYRLDMAGLEDLFPDEEGLTLGPGQKAAETVNQEDAEETQPEASTSALPATEEPVIAQLLSGQGPVLITTAPRPCKATFSFLEELQSLFGGKKYAHIVPRRDARFQLSKVCSWAAKRGYRALLVIGEDHKQPSSVTLTKLPLGPTAHFRLTSVQATKHISGHAAPTSHAPELVLSNMSTPLGLSVGRLLQTLFPPLPQLEGRQVVAVHNQRDFIFFRRFRYMFDLRADDEAVRKQARERGMDEDVRTKMQEIGPRLTLKLRWIKKGTLVEGRRRAGGQVIGKQAKEDVMEIDDEEDDGGDAVIDQDAADELEAGDASKNRQVPDDVVQEVEDSIPNEQADQAGDELVASTSAEAPSNATESEKTNKKKRKRPKTHALKDGGIRIPSLPIPAESLAEARSGGTHRIKKRKAGASILDGISFQGGMSDASKTWAWQPKMQVKKGRFFL